MNEIDEIKQLGRVCVIGGSMAGLTAARVLSNYYNEVIILERDRYPEEPGPRKGLPQARHVHVLLWRGQMGLEKLFPGLQKELGEFGAPAMDWLRDSRTFMAGRWAPQFTSGYVAHPCSRDLLEWCIRKRLLMLPNIKFMEECEVVGINMDPPGKTVTGVQYRNRADPTLTESSLLADLVVDCSGRESHVVQWLKTMGYPLPKETLVNSYLGYATRVYQKPAGDFDFTTLLIRGTPPVSKRGGVIYPIEGGRWMVTLAGAAKDYPATDDKGFMEFISSLPVENMVRALKDAVPITPISGYLKTENRWRHFEQVSRRPENLVVLGDAVCAFNPVYGQGMTVAVSGALVLDRCLKNIRRQRTGLSKMVQQQLSRVIRGPWLLATGDDYRYNETSGAERNALTGLTHHYMDHVIYLAAGDARIFNLFFEVTHLIKPISTFFAPWIMVKALGSMARFQIRSIRPVAKKTLPQEEI